MAEAPTKFYLDVHWLGITDITDQFEQAQIVCLVSVRVFWNHHYADPNRLYKHGIYAT